MPFEDRPLPVDLVLPVINPQPRKPGRPFGPNNPPPGKGRPRGTINKANKDLKNGLLTAADNLGRLDIDGGGGLIGYLEYLGIYHPKVFGHLLGRLMPLQLNADIASASISTVRVISVPENRYLSAEDIARLQGQGPIDHGPQPEQLAPPDTSAIEPEPIEEPAIEPEPIEPTPIQARPVDGYVVKPPNIARRWPKPSW